jgi:hypothetical protein
MMEVEIWLVVNADKDSELHTSEEDADDHGLSGPCRIVKLTVKVPGPEATEVEVTVPAETHGVPVVKVA